MNVRMGLLVAVTMVGLGCGDDAGPGTDAGTQDSSMNDSATPDSATPDSGLDAASMDATLPDATTHDAELPDADTTDAPVTVDAAMLDADRLDADVLDAAMLDADLADAAMLDAGADASIPDAGPVLTVEEFCASFRDLLCQWNPACREPGAVGCNFNYANDLTRACERFPSREAAGALSFDPVAGAACLQHSFVTCATPRPFETPECLGAFVRHVPIGGDCYQPTTRVFDNECVDGAACDTSASMCPGVCVAVRNVDESCDASSPCSPETVCMAGTCRPRSVAGDACSGMVCAAPLLCMNGTCRLTVGLGEQCSMTNPCNSTLLCQAGVCVNQVASGALCNMRDYLCPDGELCLPDGGQTRCTPTLLSGAPCDINGDLRQCGAEGTCVTFTDPPGDRCVTPPGIGDSCEFANCASGLICFQNECRAKSDVDGPCNMNTDCVSGLYCTNSQQCATKLDDGALCNSAAVCSSGSCGPDTNLVDRCFTPAPTCIRPDASN